MSAIIQPVISKCSAPFFDAARHSIAAGKRWSDFSTDPQNIWVFERVSRQTGCSVDDLVYSDGPRVWVHPALAPYLDEWLKPSAVSNRFHHQEKTMNAIVSFNFEGFEVRTVDIAGEPWFVGKDVAERLGYADPTNAMKQHCRGVAKHHPIVDALGRTQETRILSEPDVLRLIIGSKLPAAERFERWVFEEVLPTIRRTGGYGSGTGLSDSQTDAVLRLADAVITLSAQVGALSTQVAAMAATHTAPKGKTTKVDAVPLPGRSPKEVILSAVRVAGSSGITLRDLGRKTQMIRRHERREIINDLSADGLVLLNYVHSGKSRPALWVRAA